MLFYESLTSSSYMYQLNGSLLVQALDCCLLPIIQSTELMANYYQYDPWQWTLMTFQSQHDKKRNVLENAVSKIFVLLSKVWETWHKCFMSSKIKYCENLNCCNLNFDAKSHHNFVPVMTHAKLRSDLSIVFHVRATHIFSKSSSWAHKIVVKWFPHPLPCLRPIHY